MCKTRDQKLKYQKEWRAKNKKDLALKKKKWRAENKEAILEYQNKWRAENKEAISLRKKQREEHKEKERKRCSKWSEKNRDYIRNKSKEDTKNLTDTYVKSLITGKSDVLKFSDVPQSYVEAKREQIKIYRLLINKK